MCHLEHVNRLTCDSIGQELWVHLLLRVAGEQEPALADPDVQYDRHVVDARACVGCFARNLAAPWPQDVDRGSIERQAGRGREGDVASRAAAEDLAEGGIAGSRPQHPRISNDLDSVPLEKQRQAGDMILVGMGEDDQIDPPIVGRNALVKARREQVRIRASVHQDAAAARSFQQDCVALSNVQHRHLEPVIRPARAQRSGHDE